MVKKDNQKNIKEIEKIRMNGKISICDLQKLLDLNYEITFEYENEIYEIIQNGDFIELHFDCSYVFNKTKSLSYVQFLNSTDFIENAVIKGKKIIQIIDEIEILHC